MGCAVSLGGFDPRPSAYPVLLSFGRVLSVLAVPVQVTAIGSGQFIRSSDLTIASPALAGCGCDHPPPDYAMVMPPFLERLEPELRAILGPDVEIELTGGGVMFTRIFENVIITLARSYAFCLLIITPLMILSVYMGRIWVSVSRKMG